ncbi:uncharacterized protein LOC142224757 [Haematobia irritans]|uniref:uncharacterized protein LOC142224757 n=1 Tax=Haematobia irritans TaxID=7368 RepID=UPI003F4FCCD5
MQSIRIPRSYLQCFQNYDNVDVQLHTFVDASREGYAAVCYFRMVRDSTTICSLIGSKTKVAPLKITSVPRLELMAALIGARFADFITKNHTIKISHRFFWSDSKTVLSWINSDHRKYHQFVAFRITEILDLSSINEWHWITSKQNVADDATRWNKIPNISQSNRWFKGPDFLYQPEESWPKLDNFTHATQEEMVCHLMKISENKLNFDVYRFSNWKRLLRSTAYVVRFIENCKQPKKEKESHNKTDYLTLSPQILSYESRNSSERNSANIFNRTIYKSVTRDCQACRIHKAIPRTPEMAKLPRARLASYMAPFTFSGVDFFGPIWVTVNRHKEKRYGCLFTCLTVRAIHIEVAHSLYTDSCILAIRNFISRRGIPREFYSDNGTNFIGAERELRQSLAEVDKDAFVRAFTSATCKWNFNPPAAPHMGGAWERLVRSIKTVLYRIMPTRSPSDELLRSMFIEIENVVNSRPLVYVPLDEDSSEALTSNHFLLGSSSGMKPLISCDDAGITLKQNWRISQQYANIFWRKWVLEYLPTLTCRTKWHEKQKPLQQGDLVIVVDPSLPRNVWVRGKVLETRWTSKECKDPDEYRDHGETNIQTGDFKCVAREEVWRLEKCVPY